MVDSGVVEGPIELAEVASFLSHAIGQEKALAAVTDAARQLGFGASAVNREGALAILDRIATLPGIVGITARFAKSRLHLKWAASE